MSEQENELRWCWWSHLRVCISSSSSPCSVFYGNCSPPVLMLNKFIELCNERALSGDGNCCKWAKCGEKKFIVGRFSIHWSAVLSVHTRRQAARGIRLFFPSCISETSLCSRSNRVSCVINQLRSLLFNCCFLLFAKFPPANHIHLVSQVTRKRLGSELNVCGLDASVPACVCVYRIYVCVYIVAIY
jgi:hypothetical protein